MRHLGTLIAWVSRLGSQVAPAQDPGAAPLRLRDVQVIPCTDESQIALTNQAVLIHERRIQGLGTIEGDKRAELDARLVALRERFAAPAER